MRAKVLAKVAREVPGVIALYSGMGAMRYSAKPTTIHHLRYYFAILVVPKTPNYSVMSDKLRDPETFAKTNADQQEPRLSDEDQSRVDDFLKRGVNSVERKPFRPVFLIFLLIAVVTGFSLLSQGIAMWAGVY